MKLSLGLFSLLFPCSKANASQDLNYGLNPIDSARLGSVAAQSGLPSSALYNPALLASDSLSSFGFSSMLVRGRFPALKGVVVDSPKYRTVSGEFSRADRQLGQVQSTLWSASFSYPFALPFWKNHRSGLGFVASGPFSSLRTFESGTPYDFYVLRYGNSDRQFKATAAIALELITDTLYFGTGASLFISTAGAAEAELSSNNPPARLALDVGFNTSPIFGIYFKKWNWGAAAVYRGAIAPKIRQQVTGSVRVGETRISPDPILLSSSLYFEPGRLDMDLQHTFADLTISVGVSYQLWSAYEPHFLQTQSVGRNSPTTDVAAIRPALSNSWNPKVSFQTSFLHPSLTLAGGYQFRPSPLGPGQTTGPLNILDSDTHLFGLGFQHRLWSDRGIGEDLGTAPGSKIQWGPFAQFHKITSQNFTKGEDTLPGAPGYVFSGQLWVFGLGLEATL